MNDEQEKKAAPPEEQEIEESIAARRLRHFEPNIKEGDGKEAVLSREPGFFGLVKHIWFHYKGFILAGIFLLLVLAVCLAQCATRPQYDLDLLYAGPWKECDNTTERADVLEAFSHMMQDYNEDGEKNIAYSALFLLSGEQLDAIRDQNDALPEEEQIYINGNLLRENRDLLDNGVMTGKPSICLLDPSVYAYFKENGVLDDLGYYVDSSLLPETTLDGGLGVYLKDTAFGRYFGAFADMPEDTILCVRRPGVMNQTWGREDFSATREKYADLLTTLFTF